jgi:uncharacterized membrane protein
MTTRASRLTKYTVGSGSFEQLTQRNIEVVRKLEEAANEQRTTSDHFARMIAKFCGSMTFDFRCIARGDFLVYVHSD